MSEIIKVAVVGPESTGKTVLSEHLAKYFKCSWVPEYAREYLEKLDRPYTKHDVEEIAKGQIAAEDAAAEKSQRLLICDTNLLVVKIWMQHKYQHVPQWIEDEIQNRSYHLHFLTAPDIPYAPDPLRENPEMGKYFFEKYEELLKEVKINFEVIAGDHTGRMEKAVTAIKKLI